METLGDALVSLLMSFGGADFDMQAFDGLCLVGGMRSMSLAFHHMPGITTPSTGTSLADQRLCAKDPSMSMSCLAVKA